MEREKFVTASEVGTFTFCRRNWWLQQQGVPTTLGRERAAGIAFHARHAEATRAAERAARLSPWFAGAAIALVTAALLLLAR